MSTNEEELIITDDDFDKRNKQKKIINKKQIELYFKQGDIWWLSLGLNVRSESYGKGDSFRRPVLIIKKLSKNTFIGIPLSTKIKGGTWFCGYSLHNKEGTALLYQIRMFHKNRLQRKIGELDEKDLKEIKKRLKQLLNLE